MIEVIFMVLNMGLQLVILYLLSQWFASLSINMGGKFIIDFPYIEIAFLLETIYRLIYGHWFLLFFINETI